MTLPVADFNFAAALVPTGAAKWQAPGTYPCRWNGIANPLYVIALEGAKSPVGQLDLWTCDPSGNWRRFRQNLRVDDWTTRDGYVFLDLV